MIASPFPSRAYPADPYPGSRPGVSFVELDGTGWVVRAGTSRWVVDTGGSERDLDAWLAGRDAPPLAGRLPILAYGSNANPGKIIWLREAMGLTGPAVVLEADVEGVAAVWAAGFRSRDGQRPAVLAAAPGVTERHAVWLATPEQRAVLDRAEGRGQRYRLAWLRARTTLTNGQSHDWVLAYLARPQVVAEHLNRAPLMVDGRLVRVAELEHGRARLLAGDVAESDGLVFLEAPVDPAWSDVDPMGSGGG